MKRVFVFLFCAIVASVSVAQETVLPVTGFEESLDWVFSGGSIIESFVEEAPLYYPAITPKEGNACLYVDYDNQGTEWQWVQLDFPGDVSSIVATGYTEIRMWVYWIPDESVPHDNGYEIRLHIGGPAGNANLGFQATDVAGEWVELSWPIDTLTSSGAEMAEVTFLAGFIAPRTGDVYGRLYMDDIRFVKPEGAVDTEIQLVYGFNEEDPDYPGSPLGWSSDDLDGQPVFIGIGEVEPSEGTNYLATNLFAGWSTNVRANEVKDDFDRWGEVSEIMVDARLGEAVAGGWAQSALVIQTNSGGWDQYSEKSYTSSVDSWATLVWPVDMSKHQESIDDPEDTFMTIRFSTNNDSGDAGKLVFFDNFRVVVPVQADVSGWSLY
jgi:hypothetical protein